MIIFNVDHLLGRIMPFKRLPYETCWQFMGCQHDMRKECVVYKTDMKEPCWITYQAAGGCTILATCKSCPWFLKNNPDQKNDII
jgi:hypothetical protein